MTAPNTNTKVEKYKFGRGVLYFNPLVAGIYQGFQDLGNCPGFEVTVETDTFEHFSSRGGIGEKDLTVSLSINRTGEITCDNLDNFNIALFLAGEEVTVTQSSTPVTDEVLASVTAGRSYQLGATSSNPSGIRSMSAVAVRIAEGDDAAARVNSATYAVGDIYVPATPNAHWYACTIAGAAAGSPPTFMTDGTTFADGTATFKDMGLIVVASTADVNYRLDATLGLLSVTPAGTIATALAAYAAIVPGVKLSLNVDYTPAANTRQQVRTTGSAENVGQLKFIADNPVGDNQDAFIPSANLSPNGALPFITDNEPGTFSVSVGINVLDSDTAALYVDGRPV